MVACEKIHVCSYIAKPPVNTRDSELIGEAMKMLCTSKIHLQASGVKIPGLIL